MSKPTGTVPKPKKRPNPSGAPNNDDQHQLLWPPVNNLQATEWPMSRPQPNGQPSVASDFADQFAAVLMAAEGRDSRGRQGTPLLAVQGSPHSFTRSHQSPSELDLDGRTNGFPEGNGNPLLDATKNNFSRIPDRNQVLSRLNQIRDYVKQTSALMDSLNGSSDLNHLAQSVRLSRMQSELQESETKLVEMLLILPAQSDEVPKQGLANGNASPQSFPGGAIPKARDQNQLVVNQHQQRRRVSSSEERSPGPTAAQYAKHHELKLKVEESQKKLQALVQHQAALISLQEKAQEQLRDPNSFPQELLRNWSDRADTLTSHFQDFSSNEVAGLMGDQDKELDAEYLAIQERLQEIHDRKRTVDRLNRDMQALHPRENHLSSSSDEEDEVVVNGDTDASYIEVESKVEELNSMKARLANLQSLVAAINRGEMPFESISTALATNEVEPRRELSRASSTKPDNNLRSSDTTPKTLDEQAHDIRLKAQQLDKAKLKLQQLKEILNAAGIADDDLDGVESVNSFSSATRTVEQPIQAQELEHFMRSFVPVVKQEPPSPAIPHRKNKNVKQDPISAVHEASGRSQRAFIQAKRQELVEMMRKDQGQSSSVNQDHASGFSVSETGATWGGSLGAAQSEQHNSVNCSSEELVWETDPNGSARIHLPSAFRLPQNAKSPASGIKVPVWSEQPLETSTPIYDVPPRAVSRNATPRPGGEEAPPHAQWWLLQQQQLEASNAACQSMMQQWQWAAPSPDNWWPPSPAMPQMMTTLSQCCQMLWMQQREIMNLHAALQSMQDRLTCSEQNYVGAFTNPAEPVPSVSGAHSLPNLCPEGRAFLLPSTFPWPPTQTPNNATALPPLITHGPPGVTLNNQVPPGVRANNYYDNFRSYSRQNLLSTTSKTNEGQMQHPSPLPERSHNPLRGNDEGAAAYSPVRATPPRKQKLNSERTPTAILIPAPSHNLPSPNSAAEMLFSELATLVSQNQSRPEFLPQLFKELKSLRCNADCQRVLSSVREIGGRREEMFTLEEPSASNIRSETPEGAASLPILKSPQRAGVSESQVDSKIQGLLLQLMPFLKSRRDDCCAPALLDSIVQRTLTHLNLSSFVHAQLSCRLEEALAKFQGCWLRDVGEELLATVAEVLLKELAFFKLLENVAHGEQSATQALLTQTDSLQNNVSASEPLSPEDRMDSSDSELGVTGVPPTPPQRNCWLPPSMREAAKAALEARTADTTESPDDGDLAEADQSHEVTDGRGSQVEGASAPEEVAAILETETVESLEDGWQVEQDRELDQVPSRLEPGEVLLPQPPPTQP